MTPKLAVLIPCFQEEAAVGEVVAGFRRALPQASIYVYDNNSRDRTAEVARAAGAIVRHESQQGKGHVVRRMFRDIDADFYLMVDGDGTYDAVVAAEMVELARSGPFDLVNCIRDGADVAAFPPGHRLGNDMLTGAVRFVFGNRAHDMLSGYKCLSRRFVKSFPALAQGFDIETELTVHALEFDMPIGHVRAPYRSRADGSHSKLHTFRDGWRISRMIARLVRHERPLRFFGALATVLGAASLAVGIPVIVTYFEIGLVPRLPSAVLATGAMILAVLLLMAGIILDTVSQGRREMRLLAYLQYPHFPLEDETSASSRSTTDGAEG